MPLSLAVATLQTTYGWLHDQERCVNIRSQMKVAGRLPGDVFLMKNYSKLRILINV